MANSYATNGFGGPMVCQSSLGAISTFCIKHIGWPVELVTDWLQQCRSNLENLYRLLCIGQDSERSETEVRDMTA